MTNPAHSEPDKFESYGYDVRLGDTIRVDRKATFLPFFSGASVLELPGGYDMFVLDSHCKRKEVMLSRQQHTYAIDTKTGEYLWSKRMEVVPKPCNPPIPYPQQEKPSDH